MLSWRSVLLCFLWQTWTLIFREKILVSDRNAAMKVKRSYLCQKKNREFHVRHVQIPIVRLIDLVK